MVLNKYAFGEVVEAKALLLVAFGGAIGAVLRYMIGTWLPNEGFPWGTLSVNMAGSLMLGSLVCAVSIHEMVSEEVMLWLGVGILGAFTTMSTYSVETVQMFNSGSWGSLSSYVLASTIVCPALALLGWFTTSSILAQP